jgi:hypothetical protein
MPYLLTPEHVACLDPVAIKLLQHLCEEPTEKDSLASGAKIVISSTWRILRKQEEFEDALGLPVIGMTDKDPGIRGQQIQRWLAAHPEVTSYAIIDDDSDMLESQAPHFVQTDHEEGMLYAHARQIQKILDGQLGGLYKRPEFWKEHLHRMA